MNKLTNLLVATTILLAASSCKEKKATTATVDYAGQGYVKAMIIDYELDGCKYMIQLEDKKKLEPDFVKSDFQKDSLLVWVKYKHDERLSICMAGETVVVTDMVKR